MVLWPGSNHNNGIGRVLRLRRSCAGSVGIIILGLISTVLSFPAWSAAETFDNSPPGWESLLWGGPFRDKPEPSRLESSAPLGIPEQAPDNIPQSEESVRPLPAPESTLVPAQVRPPENDLAALTRSDFPVFDSSAATTVCITRPMDFRSEYWTAPLQNVVLKSIPPLYVTPELPGEGIWDSQGMPAGDNGWPVMYRTSYRPSVQYPNAIVHMMLIDMKRASMRLYIGSAEPGGSKTSSVIDPSVKPYLLAITNALWKNQHSGGAGTVHQGTELKKLVPGMATLVVYQDDSVDILEWNDTIPLSLVRDAKQLRHLIVRDGQVVTSVIQAGKPIDSEIGMGFLLSENQPSWQQQYWGFWGGGGGPALSSGEEWFIATRSAFGIRKDGNLVFAIGHHISTKDLAKAMVLAGCVRAIHGDANPHNVVGNLYHVDDGGNVAEKLRLSPDQKTYTLDRYVNKSYTSDFFGFFKKGVGKDSPWEPSRYSSR
jgi:hypothetical protein